MDRVMELLNELYAVQPECTTLSRPEYVALHLLLYHDEKVEHFVALYVDNKNHLMAQHIISRGTVSETAVYPREIVRHALLEQASGIIIAHNHPGGDPKPSVQDQELTKKVVEACRVMDIRMLDHLIVSRGGHYSFQAQGLL
ncbi:JAB domain-containing protein [Desulfonatronum thioautotrophicum]|uniref:JAB domain-containing protein n=1 Tax=Desulfonatronum thioautotrophicum TaxID=617001 RepID=UPI00069AE407|nr:JAB domain-containing protein [Desulfonatronum thioautotrophicum]